MELVTEELELPEEDMVPISTDKPVTNDTLFELLLKEEDLTWQTLLYELVRTEQMDPWDIDLSKLSKRFVSMIKKLKSLDFRISGKVVLASAMLLRMKSDRFLVDDIHAFDSLFSSDDELVGLDEETEYVDGEENSFDKIVKDKPKIFPRTPQPRKRKVSVFDLIEALEKALDVKNRRKIVEKLVNPKVHAPKNYKDISLVISEVNNLIDKFFDEEKDKTLIFKELVQGDSKEDFVYTFIPVLHLDNQRKIDISQKYHLGDIEIKKLKSL
ncbi:segregation/condensation protein A [Candidatus Woesearchaeota archaeon]|nr:segregation/condensation protein A [Candidatus Woesearchaeota archaeon]